MILILTGVVRYVDVDHCMEWGGTCGMSVLSIKARVLTND